MDFICDMLMQRLRRYFRVVTPSSSYSSSSSVYTNHSHAHAPASQAHASNNSVPLLRLELSRCFEDMGAAEPIRVREPLGELLRVALLLVESTSKGTLKNHIINNKKRGRRKNSVSFVLLCFLCARHTQRKSMLTPLSFFLEIGGQVARLLRALLRQMADDWRCFLITPLTHQRMCLFVLRSTVPKSLTPKAKYFAYSRTCIST